MIVGIIADTHGLLRVEAFEALRGSNVILHAGDVGTPEILERLSSIAPVTAVRGNIDVKPWATVLPVTQIANLEGVRFYMIHNRGDLSRYPPPAESRVIVFGHSHKAASEWTTEGVLWLNPGSAGPRRFRLPVTLGRITIEDGIIQPEIVTLL